MEARVRKGAEASVRRARDGRAGGRAASHDECTQYVEEGVAYRSHSTPAALAGCVCVSGRRRGGAARGGG